MRRLLVLLIPFLLMGCTTPYIDSVFDGSETTLQYNNAVHSLTSAMTRGKKLSLAEVKAIKTAADDVTDANMILNYALDQYKRVVGVLGYGEVELHRKEVLQLVKRLALAVKDNTKGGGGVDDREVAALVDLFLGLPADQRLQFIKIIQRE